MSAEGCGEAVEVSAPAGSEVRERTGIDRYELRADREGYHLQLFDKRGDFLGLVRTQIVFDPQLPGEFLVHVWMSTDAAGRQVVARQWSRAQRLSEGRVQLQALNMLVDPSAGTTRKHALSWTTLDRDAQVVRTALGAVAGHAFQAPDQAFELDAPLEVLETMHSGGALDVQAVRSWLQAQRLDDFSQDVHWARMQAASNDATWMRAADLELRRCRAFDFVTDVGELTAQGASYSSAAQAMCERTSALSSSAAATMSTRVQPVCDGGMDRLVIGLKAVLVLNDWIGVASATAAILASGSVLVPGSLAVGGSVGGVMLAAGISPLGAVVGVALGVWVLQKGFEWFLNNNQDAVLGGLFDIGAAVTGQGPQAAADARAFYASSGSRGDPHLDTLDGLTYDLQSAGEFVLVRALDPAQPLEIQARQVPIAGLCSGVAVNSAAALRVGGSRVSYYAANPDAIYLNGARATLRGGVASLEGGGFIEEIDQGFAIGWPDGSAVQLVASRFADAPLVDIKVMLAPSRQGHVQGLLGNFNGNPDDDLMLADGRVLGAAITWEALHTTFADSWRVGADDSLFDYDPGEDHTTFVIPEFPAEPTRLEDLPQAARDAARAACTDAGVSDLAVMQGCVLDVVCTGDPDFARSHADRGPKAAVTMLDPINLSNWFHAGDPNAGWWFVSEDGTSVKQTLNAQPTFFISPQDYHNVIIRGSMITTDYDDDAMGFVFGFRAPTSPAEDFQREFHYDTFVFSWKQDDQEMWHGEIFRAGMMLFHLDALVDDDNAERMFGSDRDEPGKHVLATRLGRRHAWMQQRKYDFELVYTSDLIRISIDGRTVMQVHQADSPVEFLPGRFGFYNFSQAEVTYSDVGVAELE